MHKSQGFGNFNGIGGGARTANFLVLDGEPATNDIMDGIDTTWNRIPGGAEIGKQADEIIAKFDPQKPDVSVDALLNLLAALRANLGQQRLDASQLEEKERQLNKIIQNCLGLSIATTVPQAEVVPGAKFTFCQTVTVRSQVPVFWVGNKVGYPQTELLQPGRPGNLGFHCHRPRRCTIDRALLAARRAEPRIVSRFGHKTISDRPGRRTILDRDQQSSGLDCPTRKSANFPIQLCL